MKLGIMGGTFDPIHNGHISIAKAALEQYALDKVLFIPNGKAPHKRGSQITDGVHRMEMVRLAIEKNPDFVACDIELRQSEYSYSYKTLELLREEYPDPEDVFYFIMGGDSIKSLHQWKHPELVAQRCIILAAIRDEMQGNAMKDQIQWLNDTYQAKIHLLKTPNMDISSSNIREMLCQMNCDCSDEKQAARIKEKMPEIVFSYIKKHQLYSK